MESAENIGTSETMETVEALLSLSEASRSPVGSPEKPLITLLPAHSPDTGTTAYFHFIQANLRFISFSLYTELKC